MSTALHVYRADRAQMIREMRAYHSAGDHAAADFTHRLLESRHTHRRLRSGGPLDWWDVLVLAVCDLFRSPDREDPNP